MSATPQSCQSISTALYRNTALLRPPCWGTRTTAVLCSLPLRASEQKCVEMVVQWIPRYKSSQDMSVRSNRHVPPVPTAVFSHCRQEPCLLKSACVGLLRGALESGYPRYDHLNDRNGHAKQRGLLGYTSKYTCGVG